MSYLLKSSNFEDRKKNAQKRVWLVATIIIIVGFIALIALSGGIIFLYSSKYSIVPKSAPSSLSSNTSGLTNKPNSLSIEYMRNQEYPGSDITIEQTLPSGSNYSRYIASYKSDGLKIYALLTIPQGEKPSSGWPVIIFNHGYISPIQYKTTERYLTYTDAFSRNGYIVFKSDYRGHGNSEGKPEYPEYSPAIQLIY